jgi:hypothetical protein
VFLPLGGEWQKQGDIEHCITDLNDFPSDKTEEMNIK